MVTHGIGKDKTYDTDDDGKLDTTIPGSGLPLKKPVVIGQAGETGAFMAIIRVSWTRGSTRSRLLARKGRLPRRPGSSLLATALPSRR